MIKAQLVGADDERHLSKHSGRLLIYYSPTGERGSFSHFSKLKNGVRATNLQRQFYLNSSLKMYQIS